jgi:hypothetical protein
VGRDALAARAGVAAKIRGDASMAEFPAEAASFARNHKQFECPKQLTKFLL